MTETVLEYLKLKAAEAPKLGRGGGFIQYAILCDVDRRNLYLTMTGSNGGGYFSREIAAFDALEACLPADQARPFAAKAFAQGYVGKSSNNPGFAAAILRAEGLLSGVPGQPYLHQIVGDWSAWKTSMLAQEGEPYVPPVKEGLNPVGVAAMTRQELPGEAENEDVPARPKGRKGRLAKPQQGGEHAHSA